MLKEIDVTLLRSLIDLDADTGLMKWKPRPENLFNGCAKRSASVWNARYAARPVQFSIHQDGYAKMRIFNQGFQVHRVVYALHNGAWPAGHIDHINGIRTDNRPENLRSVTRAENNRNQKRHSTNTSGQMGVMWHRAARKWLARIYNKNQEIHLGLFVEFEDAVAARKAAEREYGYAEGHGRCA